MYVAQKGWGKFQPIKAPAANQIRVSLMGIPLIICDLQELCVVFVETLHEHVKIFRNRGR
jgi:hypothetical protein